uniref:Metallothionein-like protein n=1 Tax=Nelumbo nucifera TaxID=4432 RepID=A0A822Y3H0_NELNU|nr:TPA_asm: hypothetical protein HUJ06_027307 [Nelumbo nucifera]
MWIQEVSFHQLTRLLNVNETCDCRYFEGSEMSFGAENEGCKCGSNCTCNPCNCK